MNYSRYIIATTYFMAALGLWAISLVDAIGIVFVASMAIAVSLSLLFNLRRGKALPGAIWNISAVVLLAFFLVDYLMFSQSLLTSAGRFLTILYVFKLFDLNRDRDYLIAYCLVFFQILAAAASTVSPAFFIILSLFVIGVIFTMILFTIKRDWSEFGKGPAEPPVRFGPAFIGAIIAIAFMSMAITVALFFIIPRVSAGFLERRGADGIKVSGFSDKVDLGSIGPVKSDPTVVMRVGLKDVPREVIYFRGTFLDRYDWHGWRKTVKDDQQVKRSTDGIYRVAKRSGKGRFIEQEVLLEPLDTEFIFAASLPVAVEGGFQALRTDGTGSMRLPSVPYSRIEYKAWSELSGSWSQDPVYPQYIDVSYIEESPEAIRLKALGASVTAGMKTPLEKAEAMEVFFKENFTYSLDAPSSGRRMLEDFLFRIRSGYCEHYATAMVLLLRQEGIPARLVTGFLHGEWNNLGNYLIVRQQDSHSWVEAYIEGAGWMRFDPTPAAVGTYVKPSWLALYADLLRWRWNRYIVHYTSADQQRFALKLEGNAFMLVKKIKETLSFKALFARPVPVGAAVLIILLLTAAAFIMRRRGVGPSGKPPAARYYARMLRVMEKKGLKRGIGETPFEFALRAKDPLVDEITLAFNDERYGGKTLDAAGMEKILSALERLGKG